MSFVNSFSSVTLSIDFDARQRVNKLIGTKPSKDSIIIAKDALTCLEVIVPQYMEKRLQHALRVRDGITPFCVSEMIFPQIPAMVLREFRP